MPITDKLNSIITKLSDGATKPTGQTIEEKLDIIDSLIDAGGGSGGSGGIVTIEFTTVDEYYNRYISETTIDEAIAFIRSGKLLMFHAPALTYGPEVWLLVTAAIKDDSDLGSNAVSNIFLCTTEYPGNVIGCGVLNYPEDSRLYLAMYVD